MREGKFKETCHAHGEEVATLIMLLRSSETRGFLLKGKKNPTLT